MRRGEAGLPTCCAEFLGLGAARVCTACTWRCLCPLSITIIIIRRSTGALVFSGQKSGLVCFALGRSVIHVALLGVFRSLGLGWVCFALL